MAVQQPTLYNIEDHHILFGTFEINGFTDGTFIKIDAAAEEFTEKSGADGFVSVIRRPNYLSKIEITLSQSSDSNDKLMLIFEAQKGNVVLPLTVLDNNGTSKYMAKRAWVRGIPSQTWANDAESRTWMISAFDSLNIVGGHNNI